VAATPAIGAGNEREAIEPFARQVVDFVRRVDPDVTYTLAPPIDPGIWLLYLYVSPGLADDPDFGERIAERTVDILIEHGVGLATLRRARSDAVGGQLH
jgi:hypothetical protein